ncbi:MAG TPA: hypothetical protein VKE74_24135, partial [Gemmataceae bacterium]|nr:hypothetical protein [Gemmataceae bacterium]
GVAADDTAAMGKKPTTRERNPRIDRLLITAAYLAARNLVAPHSRTCLLPAVRGLPLGERG